MNLLLKVRSLKERKKNNVIGSFNYDSNKVKNQKEMKKSNNLNNSNFALFLQFSYEIIDDTPKFIKFIILISILGFLIWLILHKSIELIRKLAILGVFQSYFSVSKLINGISWIFG